MEAIAQMPNVMASDIQPFNYDTLLIYRTDINTKKRVKILQSFFDQHPKILHWNVDLQDIDNVLRLEIICPTAKPEILHFIHACGLHCEELED